MLDDQEQEFPPVDERRVGRRHRFGYAAGFLGGETWLLRHDLERGTTDRRPANPGGDGWVLAVTYDPDRAASDLLVLHAADFTSEPAAVVHLLQRVPWRFHGNWVPSSAK